MRGSIFVCSLVLVANIIISEAQRVPEEVFYEQDTTVTNREKQALAKFKKAVIPRIPKSSYIQNYINDDLFFLKWLRAAVLNVDNAESRLLEHIKWRETQRMDTVTVEEFGDIARDYPFFLNVTDTRLRPSAEMWFSDWNFRQAALSGKGPQVIRWYLATLEMLQRQVYEARAKGVKVSQCAVLVDTEGFNIVQNACPSCLPIIGAMALGLVRQYPGLVESAIVVNMPPVFNIVLNLVRPIFGSQYGNLVKAFVTKDQWGPYVDQRYERSQITPRFGGTRDREGQKFR